MLHSACTIHLLNLSTPDAKAARRDLTHGVKHLEETAGDWPCAARTLTILSLLARKWKCELPAEAAAVLESVDQGYGGYTLPVVPSAGSQGAGKPPSPSASAKTRLPELQQVEAASRPYSQATIFPSMGISAGVADSPAEGDIPLTSSGLHSGLPPPVPPVPPALDVEMDENIYLATQWPSSSPDTSHTPCNPLQDCDGPFMPMGQPCQQPQTLGLSAGMDSQGWLLLDSVQWHRGFESCGEQQEAMLLGFQQQQQQQQYSFRGKPIATGNGMADARWYSVDDLDLSLQQGSWLAGFN